MLLALLLVPFLIGVLMFVPGSSLGRRALLLLAALTHTILCGLLWLSMDSKAPLVLVEGWLQFDTLGLFFLSIASVLFLAASVYSIGYLQREKQLGERPDISEGILISNEPEAIFLGCLLLFLSAMTLVTMSQHFGLLWVAVEATTLASAPLIYFHKQHRSLEATWKYLLICSVGIALALLGNFALAASAASQAASKEGTDEWTYEEVAGREAIPLVLDQLLAHAGDLRHGPLKIAFLFILVGYGTKMGLAPMHTWLPDAHSEAPSLVSALLSGALLNCAFLGILRCHQVCLAAGLEDFTRDLLIVFGLLSMAVAAIFILNQTDFKRMLAYSSIEHMGILSLGVGLGGAGACGAMLHAFNHSLTKACLFLVAGNILTAFHTKEIGKISGLFRVLPVSAALWFSGFLAITGFPPFGTFLSEFTILKSALDQQQIAVGVLYLVFLALIFISMARSVLGMLYGSPNGSVTELQPEPLWSIVPAGLLASMVLVLGVYVPPAFNSILQTMARTLGGSGW